MSTPVIVAGDRWAGNFDCSVCGRKRLIGSEFSRKALERHKKNGTSLKCKKCVSDEQTNERVNAMKKAEASKNKSNSIGDATTDEKSVCSSCMQSLSASLFNRNQLSKGDRKRCRSCVEKSLVAEKEEMSKTKADKITKAKEKVQAAISSGSAIERVKAEAELCALEAERVTGLKPVCLGRGKGRGRSSGRGRGRGRSSTQRFANSKR